MRGLPYLIINGNNDNDVLGGGPTRIFQTFGITYEKLMLVGQASGHREVRDLSLDNDIIIVEFGGDLLSASVPGLLTDPSRLNIIAFGMAIESATAAIGMETKRSRIPERYKAVPEYVVGPSFNLRANRNRVKRENDCVGCYDLGNENNKSVLVA